MRRIRRAVQRTASSAQFAPAGWRSRSATPPVLQGCSLQESPDMRPSKREAARPSRRGCGERARLSPGAVLVPVLIGLAALWATTAAGTCSPRQAAAFALVVASSAGLARIAVLQEIEQRRAAKARADQSSLYSSTLRALGAAIDARDNYSHEHVALVESVACDIAHEMGMNQTDLEGIRSAALLLDVGTLGVPENILLQPGRLTAAEFATIHNHPVVSAQILESVPFPWPVQKAIRAHHERWDGSGYPDRLRGEEIPLGARILAVADVYAALISNRSFRSGWTHEQAVTHIRDNAGKLYAPQVVEAFLKVESRIPESFLPREAAPSPTATLTIQRASQQFVALWEISQCANACNGLKETLQAVGQRICTALECDACAIFIDDEQSHSLVCHSVTPQTAKHLLGLHAEPGAPGTGQVARDQHGLIVRATNDVLITQDGRNAALRYEWAAIAPLGAGRTILGTVNLYRSNGDFSIEELDQLAALARHASVPIASASLFDATRESAERDSLTGLYNLRYFCSQVEHEFSRAKRGGRSFSVIAVDLDHFKAVNDTLGHTAGDALLRDLARLFVGAVRNYDSVVRYGGDEFVIVLPEAGADEAVHTIDRLQSAVHHYVDQLTGLKTIQFGASFGAATFPGDAGTVKDLLTLADQRMYENKRKAHANRKAA